MANLGSPKNTIEIIQKYAFVFKKKFGQNFLIDTNIWEHLIDSADIKNDDGAIEIGPGIVNMTPYLEDQAR